MRMHRGSSKGVRESPRAAGSLPLSASLPSVRVVLEITRGSSVDRRDHVVESGTSVRAVLRRAGQPGEGCAVLLDGTPIPLDTPIDRALTLVVVPTFSGG